MAENILVGVFAVIVVAAVIIAWKFENGRSEYVEEQDDTDQERGEKQA